MSRAVTITRHAADDRRGPAHLSPFRSESEAERYCAAQVMVAKREHEIAGLEKILSTQTDPVTVRRIKTRILASKRNLTSWNDYLKQHAPREPRAVIHPTPVRVRKSRAKTLPQAS